jgi:hypothetical protein
MESGHFITGIQDVDEKILLSLPLYNLRKICNLNGYTFKICSTSADLKNKLRIYNNKTDNLISIINRRSSIGVKLYTNEEYQTLKIFNDILLQCNITESNVIDPSELDNMNIINFSIDQWDTEYRLVFELAVPGTFLQQADGLITYFIPSVNELKDFLLNIYYDDLLLHY